MLDDIEAYDKAKKHKSEAIPFKQAIKEIKNHQTMMDLGSEDNPDLEKVNAITLTY